MPDDAFLVLTMGRLHPNKGFDVLWQSWLELAGSDRWNASLVVVGDGWRMPRWRAEAARSAVAGSVRFLGFIPDLAGMLAAGDLLVSPVRYESYGLNVHEALCRGLAVMVTRSAGVVERFDDSMGEALLPDGIAPMKRDLRFDTPTEKMNLVNQPIGQRRRRPPDVELVAPGRPELSELLTRISTRGPYQMPPLATHYVDPRGYEVLRRWIAALPKPRE